MRARTTWAAMCLPMLGGLGLEVSASGQERLDGNDAQQDVLVLRVPGDGLQPQAAVDDNGVVHLISFSGDPAHGDIDYRRSEDGERFGAPVRVNSTPGSAVALGTVRGPQLALGPGGRVHVAWNASSTASSKRGFGEIHYSRFGDDGETFEPERSVAGDIPHLDGGASLCADGDGSVYITWHAPQQVENATEADRRIWVIASEDGGSTFGAPRIVFGDAQGACACCGMSALAMSPGRMLIQYRSAREMVHRDMHVLMSTDRGRTFEPIVVDPWEAGACVMSTGHLIDAGAAVVGVWETEEQIKVGRFSHDGRLIDVQRMPGGAGGRKHPAVAANSEFRFIVAWAEGTGWAKGGSVGWQVFDRDGRAVPGEAGRADGLPMWSMPAVLARPNGGFLVLY